jgi:hypothetical protein
MLNWLHWLALAALSQKGHEMFAERKEKMDSRALSRIFKGKEGK